MSKLDEFHQAQAVYKVAAIYVQTVRRHLESQGLTDAELTSNPSLNAAEKARRQAHNILRQAQKAAGPEWQAQQGGSR